MGPAGNHRRLLKNAIPYATGEYSGRGDEHDVVGIANVGIDVDVRENLANLDDPIDEGSEMSDSNGFSEDISSNRQNVNFLSFVFCLVFVGIAFFAHIWALVISKDSWVHLAHSKEVSELKATITDLKEKLLKSEKHCRMSRVRNMHQIKKNKLLIIRLKTLETQIKMS